ncbi:MAG: acetyl-CoA carboxylase biotin carboxyl carrier protein subunit [Candidatus Melainabacteria bacterium]
MRDVTIIPLQPGEALLQDDHQVRPFYWRRTASQILLWLGGKQYAMPLPEAGQSSQPTAGGRGANRGHAAPASDKLTAPMPGTVLKVLAGPGDSVTHNQPLIVMESMKMELTLNSPATGKIATLHCQENQLVALGELLVQLTPEAEA